MRGLIKYILLSVAIIFFASCSSKENYLNEPISKENFQKLKVKKVEKREDKVSLILTFSGGGTRAASFAYGVLKELKNQNMLHEVDVISSVSGGSFTSAYYGLYGDKIFDEFEDKFLKKPIQSNLISSILNPFNWFDFSISSRSEYVANYYEKEIFGKKTFKDLRVDSPKIVINATDISTGNVFSFSPENFRKICSDWDSYPIGKAVTASSAVPVLLSPITLKNYPHCELNRKNIDNMQYLFTYNDKQYLDMEKYHDKESYKYLHLVDGGISDNLGIRSLLHIVVENDNNFLKVLDKFGIPNGEKIAIIVVNASDTLSPKIAQNQTPPNIPNTLNAISTIQLKRYNTDTLDLVNFYFKEWSRQIKEARCKDKKGCKGIEFYLIELNFAQLPPKEAKKYMLTQTSLELNPKLVDEIIDVGQTLLKNSKEFQKLKNDIK
jgi:NTE family protein